jgi:arylsulfatase A-like enzyme
MNTPDIMPTLLSMLDLPIPREVEGVDLSHCALERAGAVPQAALMQNTGACAIWEDGHEWRALRDGRYTYAVFRVDGSELLFDNVADPWQMKNLTSDPEATPVLARFRTMLKARMADLKDTFECCTWYRDHWTADRVILRGARE